jgi:hypothetical protein
MNATIDQQFDTACKTLRDKLSECLAKKAKAFGVFSLKLTVQDGRIVLVETSQSETEKP